MPSSEQRSANEFELFVRYEQRKMVDYQPQSKLSGDTDFQFSLLQFQITARNYTPTALKVAEDAACAGVQFTDLK